MKKILLFIPLVCCTLAGLAQDIGVAEQHIPQTVPFAQPFVAHIQLSHPQGQTVVLDEESVSPDFALKEWKTQPISPQLTQARLLLVPFAVQPSTFTVSFSLAGQPQNTVSVQSPVTVTPVKLFDDEELKEIRPPHTAWNWALWLCILLALFALVCLFIWWVRHIKKENALLQNPPDNRPAHVIALSQIDRLLNSGLWENKHYKIFYITLTDILRSYLQKAFGLDVSADTSAELLRHLKAAPQTSAFVKQLRVFLSSGDLVKFAKAVPDEKTRNTDVTILREFIRQTAPTPAQQAPSSVEVKL